MDWLTNTFWDTFGFWNSSVMGFTKLINYFSQESPVHSFCLSTTVSLHIYKGCMGFPGGARGKEPTCQCRRPKRRGFTPWVRKILWRRAWQPTPVFLPGGARQATVHSITKNWAWLKRLSTDTRTFEKHSSNLPQNSQCLVFLTEEYTGHFIKYLAPF